MCCFNKFFFFTINVIVFVFGVAVIALASIVIDKESQYGELLSEGYITIPVWILIFGILITIIGFMGCFGALREHECMLYTYAMVVLVLFIGEIVLGIMILVNPEVVKDAVGKTMYKQFSKYTYGPQEDQALNALIDQTQRDLECCGVYSYNDWNDDDFLWDGGIRLPDSCCVDESIGCTAGILGLSANVYEEGCLDALSDEFQDLTLALGITALILCFVLFFSVSTACGLARRSGKIRR